MAKFYDNILKPEEESGAYNVGEPDDDTFQLKDNEYPAPISDFAVIVEPLPEPDIEEEAEIEPTIETLPEIKNDPVPANDNEPTQVPDTSDDIPVQSPATNDAIEDANDTIWDTFDNSFDDNTEDTLLKTASTDPSDFIENTSIESTKQEVGLDEDFKNELASIIGAPKSSKKSETIEPLIVENAELSNPPIDFKPVEEIEKTEYVDITDIDTSRASERTSQDESVINEPKKDSPQKEKKKKSSVWLTAAIFAGFLIILSGLMYLILTFLVPEFYNKEKIAKKDSTSVKVLSKKSKIIEKSIDSLDKPIVIKEDSNKVIKNVVKESEKNVQKVADKKIVKATEVNTEKPKIVKDELLAEKKQNKPKLPEDIKPKQSKPINKTPNSNTKKEIATTKISKESNKVTKPISKQPIKTAKHTIEINPVYVIQVYSSPSKEDAQDWVNKLKSKSIDAYLSEQMVRDVKWYRVRFGDFKSREEARSVALRYGFSQTWIDRIK